MANQDIFVDLFTEIFPRRAHGFVELRALPRKARTFVDPSDQRAIRRFLNEHSQQELYFGVATRLQEGDGRLENCGDLWALFVDIDYKSTAEDDARRRLDTFALRPSILVASGFGLHGYFLLRDVVNLQREPDRVHNLLRRLAHALGGDLRAAEPAHILRVPGTLNYKYDPPRPVTIEHVDPQCLYSLADFEQALSAEPAPTGPPTSFTMRATIPKGQRNELLYRLGRSLSARKLSRAAIFAALRAENQEKGLPPLGDEELENIVAHVVTQPDRAGFSPSPDSFPSLEGRVGHEKQLFRPLALSRFLVEQQDPIIWVVGDYIPEGALAVLVSYPKVGKTTWIFALIVAVATGKTFMGFATSQGPVLLLAVEEHRREVKARLLRFGARPDDAIYVHATPLDHDADVFSRIAAFIREHQIRLVVLDTLGSFWQISDENNNAEVERRLRPWRDLARSTNCAVVLIHHERKIKGSGGREIRGGSALLGGVDQALLLDHRQGGSRTQRVLRAIGRYDNTPKELILELVGNDYAALGTPADVSGEALIETVAAALSGEWQGIPAIATMTKIHVGQVRRALETLRERDQAERAGAGKKGDPYTYRRRPDAFRPQGHPKGKKSKLESRVK